LVWKAGGGGEGGGVIGVVGVCGLACWIITQAHLVR
jgi:hypothetical protein